MFLRILCTVIFGIFQLSSFQCRKLQEKIIGGMPTDISKVPYQIALLYEEGFICGGSIIDSSWIATAAHCVHKMDTTKFSIRAGSSFHSKDGKVIQGIKVIHHEKYNPKSFVNDIALIKLKTSLKPLIGPTIQLVKLPELDENIPPSDTISGWGLTQEHGGEASPILRSAIVTSFKKLVCTKKYGKSFHNREMFCAGQKEGGVDACQGDSGGPLVFNNTLYGVVSFGVGCGRAKKPGVYTRVPYFVNWIQETIESNKS